MSNVANKTALYKTFTTIAARHKLQIATCSLNVHEYTWKILMDMLRILFRPCMV